jgi:hypothetical protein
VPPLETGSVGPPCPRCGAVWPVSERRCPSCLARHRYADGQPPPEFFQAEEAQAAAEAPEASQEAAEEHWHRQHCDHGRKVAAGTEALLALVSLLAATASPHPLAWIGAAVVLLALAFGLWRGSIFARGIAIFLPLLVLVLEEALLLAYAPSHTAMAAVLAVTLALIALGVRTLTVKHGRNGTVLIGAAATGAGLLLLLINPCLLSAANPAWPTITGAMRSQLSGAAPVAVNPPPAAPRQAEPLSQPTPAPAPMVNAAAPKAPVMDAESPMPSVALETTSPQTTTQPAAAAAVAIDEANQPMNDGSTALAARGIALQFPDPVKAIRSRQKVFARDLTVETYTCSRPTLQCAALIFLSPGTAPGAAAPAVSPEALIDAAHYVAAQISLPLEYEMWRTETNPPVYFVRLSGPRDGQAWQVRIESRALDGNILVLVGQHQISDEAAKVASWNFFKSLSKNQGR